MTYSIKPLCPELARDFTNYLGSLDFHHAPHWSTCYCMYYQTNCSIEIWQNRTGDENRAEAVKSIEKGTMRGYLAYDGGKCIGWCHANHTLNLPRIEAHLASFTSGKRVGCVICFVVHQDYRGKGVARLLLKKAVEDFAEQGYDAVVALPVENREDREKQYRGTMNMYAELGFEKISLDSDTEVMWLAL